MISLWESLLMISIIWILGSLMSSNFVIKCNCSICIFLMSCLLANKIGSIISMGIYPLQILQRLSLQNNIKVNKTKISFCSLFSSFNRTLTIVHITKREGHNPSLLYLQLISFCVSQMEGHQGVIQGILMMQLQHYLYHQCQEVLSYLLLSQLELDMYYLYQYLLQLQ